MKLRDLLTYLLTGSVLAAMASSLFALEPDDPALVGVWLFDEGEGDEVGDSSGNENAGLMGIEEDFEWGDGKFGGGLAAFGAGNIDVENSDSIGSIAEALTVAGWFRIDADSDTGVRKNGAFLLEDQSASEPVPDGWSFRIWTSDGLSPGYYGTTELEQETWYHIAGTYDSESEAMELYINGVPESEAEGGVLRDNGEEWDPIWGGDIAQAGLLQLKYGPESYTGAMDEIVIYNRALSQAEIVELMGGWANLGGGGIIGDVDGDGDCDAADIDAIAAAISGGNSDAKFDLNNDGSVDDADRVSLIKDLKNTWIGDSNLDGEFNSSDF
ncbi:MAG: hypothetical protein KDB27_04335, partial [Planctomycetales bacterium]|nr:hypothetical protein [Planctomycetales bacterium]